MWTPNSKNRLQKKHCGCWDMKTPKRIMDVLSVTIRLHIICSPNCSPFHFLLQRIPNSLLLICLQVSAVSASQCRTLAENVFIHRSGTHRLKKHTLQITAKYPMATLPRNPQSASFQMDSMFYVLVSHARLSHLPGNVVDLRKPEERCFSMLRRLFVGNVQKHFFWKTLRA